MGAQQPGQRKDCTFHNVFCANKPFNLLDLLANLCNSSDQCARVHSVDANNLPNLRATSQNIMSMARKSDCSNLREDVTIKNFLENIRHSVARSNNLQGMKVRESFNDSNTSGKNCCCRIARQNDTHTPARTIRISPLDSDYSVFRRTGYAKQFQDFPKPKSSSESVTLHILYTMQQYWSVSSMLQASPRAEGKIDFATTCTSEKGRVTHRSSQDIEKIQRA